MFTDATRPDRTRTGPGPDPDPDRALPTCRNAADHVHRADVLRAREPENRVGQKTAALWKAVLSAQVLGSYEFMHRGWAMRTV